MEVFRHSHLFSGISPNLSHDSNPTHPLDQALLQARLRQLHPLPAQLNGVAAGGAACQVGDQEMRSLCRWADSKVA